MSNLYNIKKCISSVIVTDKIADKLSIAKKNRNGKMFLLDNTKLEKWKKIHLK